MRELADLTEPEVISAAADRVRLSILGGRTQVDVSLPLDVPIAILMPTLVKLIRSRETTASETLDGPFPTEAKRSLWDLRRADGKTSLPPDVTLRQAGVADGELLQLSASRALSAPTLYDDVVDAAARLNKAGYASWDATAARWMAFVGVHLASAVWVYLLFAHALAPNREVLVGLSAVAALALTGVATLAHRSHGRADIGAALGWAALPVFAAIAYAAVSRLGEYGLSAGSAAMVLVCVALCHAVGTGYWGFLATGVFFGFSGIALVVHAAGVPADIVGAGLAVVTTLGCLSVPLLKARSTHITAPPRGRGDDAASANNLPARRGCALEQVDAAATPSAAETVWARAQWTTLTRSAFYAGLASSAAVGAWFVLLSPDHLQWSGLAFASACAATLGLYAQRCVTAAERAALVIPAVALLTVICVLAAPANQPMPLAALITLLTVTISCAAIGATARIERTRPRSPTLLAYSAYLGTAALIPLALWVTGAYGRLGIA